MSSFFDREDYGGTRFGVEGNKSSVLVVFGLPVRHPNGDVKLQSAAQKRGWGIFNRIISPECAGGPIGQLWAEKQHKLLFYLIILDAELRTDYKEERMEARRPGRRLLQSYRQKKSILAWTKAVVVEVGKRGQVQDIFWKKESTDLNNTFYMRGEGDGKVRDDPQV